MAEGGTLRVSSQKSLNPNHLGARNDLLSSDLKLARLGIPPQQHLVPPVPDLNHEPLQSLVPAGSSSNLLSLVPADSRSQPGISLQQNLVPLGSRGSLHQHQDQWIASPRRHRCVQAHNSAPYEKDARFSSGTQHFSARFTTWTNSKDRRSHKKSSWKYCRSPTLLPLFPATNPDIPLKEIKAFYPLRTPGETQDPCLSKSPRLHPSRSCKKRKFPVMESRIGQSTRKALVPRSLQVLKDKSTGPPRKVASTPQQRSPFLQGPVTGLRTIWRMSKLTEASGSPSPSNPTSLGESYVGYKTGKQILSSTEIQDQGPESYKITFEQGQNLEVLIKTPVFHLEKMTLLQVLTRSRPKKKSEKGKQHPVHYKHAEMERLRLAKLHMLSPDFTHEIER
ncbi:LOW QUALITY PROTEIN: hypothetical protein HID58_059986 [Brassica napus]|uniref:Uncharacterized protein n=1 Tax=Brassica napus TaxID=3708 RepID=A0ABQ7ZUG9_BRANA|nr:LOW QUALITY PROTEIN: hypothetical protein HID58_059986 [Brassica napus]